MGPSAQHANFKGHNYESLCVALYAAQALCSMIISLILHGNAVVLDFDSQLAILHRALTTRERRSKPAPTATTSVGGAKPTPTYKCLNCGEERTLCASLVQMKSSSGSSFYFPTFCFPCSRRIPAEAKDLPVSRKLAILAALPFSPSVGGKAAARGAAQLSPTGGAPPDTKAIIEHGEGRVAPAAPAKTACHEMGPARLAQSPPALAPGCVGGVLAAARGPAEPPSTGMPSPDTNAVIDHGEGRVAPAAPDKTANYEVRPARVAQSPPAHAPGHVGETESPAKKAPPLPRGRKTGPQSRGGVSSDVAEIAAASAAAATQPPALPVADTPKRENVDGNPAAKPPPREGPASYVSDPSGRGGVGAASGMAAAGQAAEAAAESASATRAAETSSLPAPVSTIGGGAEAPAGEAAPAAREAAARPTDETSPASARPHNRRARRRRRGRGAETTAQVLAVADEPANAAEAPAEPGVHDDEELTELRRRVAKATDYDSLLQAYEDLGFALRSRGDAAGAAAAFAKADTVLPELRGRIAEATDRSSLLEAFVLGETLKAILCRRRSARTRNE